MSLLIKGMDMPKNCLLCPCCVSEGIGVSRQHYCQAIDNEPYVRGNYRPEDCPLVKAPNFHDRLIDPHDDNVGAVLECAIKWTIGRKTYMVSVVTGVIKSVVPDLNNKTLLLMEREIVKHERFFDSTDRKEWIPLRDIFRREIDKRKLERWK